MVTKLFIRISLASVLLLAVFILGCPGAKSSYEPVATPVTDSAAPVDSATAVALARRVLMEGDPTVELRVTKFERRGETILIEMRPEPPKNPEMVTLGGGGLVEVASDGTVTVLRLYR